MQSRRLLVNSMPNMRELGGFAAADGGVTRYARFIRSNVPSRLSDEDIAFLKDYGLKAVIDLRMREEAEYRPSSLSEVEGIAYYNIPFAEDLSLGTGGVHFSPKDHYISMIEGPTNLKRIFSIMASQPEGAVLFNCSAGKDRTGIIAALLLLLAGVPREDIVADYQVTFTYMKAIIIPMLAAAGQPPEVGRSDPEWMEILLDYFEETGGIEVFLRGVGLEDEKIQILKDKLLR